MTDTPKFWPTGTGQWNRLARLVLADDVKTAMQVESAAQGTMVLGTPLELIGELERCTQLSAASVVLVGHFARDEVADALRDIYPGLDVVIAANAA
jgi:alkanesulfonate monooxygenase SsuD/methylene tetrahydromethanopterin reductase-like flavin-dependent oxidoreductase (luciferase family)